MRTLFSRPSRWLASALMALCIASACSVTAHGQFPDQRRPGLQPGQQRPGLPPGQRRVGMPPQPLLPGAAGRVEIVFKCPICDREVSRGAVPPAVCPFCGAAMAHNFAVPVVPPVRRPPPAPPEVSILSSTTFRRTLAIEGSLLAGLVLAGIVRIVAERAALRNAIRARESSPGAT
jgi:hypothetical protein